MRTTNRRLVAAFAACSFAVGCSTTKVDKVQKVSVESDPPGALVFVNESGARRALGRTPLTVDQPYEAWKHESNPACWMLPVLGVVGAVGGYKFLSTGIELSDKYSSCTSTTSPTSCPTEDGSFETVMGAELLVFGILGGIGGLVGCATSEAQDGIETPAPGFDGVKKRIEVEAPGFVTQVVDVSMPGADKKLALFLPPLGSSAVAAAPTLAPVLAPGLAAPYVPPAAPALAAHSGPHLIAAPAAAAVSAGAATRPAAGLVAGAPQPSSFALVIGIERYRDVPAPTGARADAERFAALAKSTLGVPERNVILALDDRASRADLDKHLRWLENNVPVGGRVYLFFAGHGAPDAASGTSYLLPYDADPADLPGTALKLSDVTARLGKTKARDVVAFLDACFSGTGGRSVIAAGTRPLVPVGKLEAAPRVSVLAAVTGAQISGALPGGAEGLFSHYLGEALGNAKADLDGDGQISLRELHDWIKPRVEREAKRESREQVPSLTVGDGVDAAGTVLAIGVSGG